MVDEYRYWQRHVIVSVDGVEHFSSTKVHCSGCTIRRRSNGVISYHHAGLAAILLDPEQREVFPLDFEPILREDGAEKNDCEHHAAKRLSEQLHQRYPGVPMIMVEDALYANAPHIRQITGYGWRYILNVKPESHRSLEGQFAGRRLSGQVKEWRVRDEQGVEHYYGWVSHLDLCEVAPISDSSIRHWCLDGLIPAIKQDLGNGVSVYLISSKFGYGNDSAPISPLL